MCIFESRTISFQKKFFFRILKLKNIYLWSQISRCSNDTPPETLLSNDASKAEIAKFHLWKIGIRSEQDVFGFQIAVHNVQVMQVSGNRGIWLKILIFKNFSWKIGEKYRNLKKKISIIQKSEKKFPDYKMKKKNFLIFKYSYNWKEIKYF